jgi:hypothetical protein
MLAIVLTVAVFAIAVFIAAKTTVIVSRSHANPPTGSKS